MCAKVIGGGLQEGGGFPIYFFIFQKGGGLNKIMSKYMYMGGGIQEGAAYKSEYGTTAYFLCN